MGEPSLFISAGDLSGDRATARVVKELKRTAPGLDLFGLGGSRLADLGMELLANPAELAVIGFWEVAKKFLFFRRLLNECSTQIRERKPRAVLLVDYPGFNLRLAKRIRPLGIPVIYYISPQVWAWGKGRLAEIRENTDQVLVILPFEEQFFRNNGVSCRFVGHYLMEDIPAGYIASDLPGSGQLALLPGSRPQEIERILPPMLETAAMLFKERGVRSVVAGIEGAFDYDRLCRAYADRGVSVSYDGSRTVVYESDIVLTKSGTATLECGIIGRPMVIVYRTGWITYQIARRLVELTEVGLVNLVLGDKVVPELIQHEMTPAAMALELKRYFDNSAYRNEVVSRLKSLPSLLGATGASRQAADAIGSYL